MKTSHASKKRIIFIIETKIVCEITEDCDNLSDTMEAIQEVIEAGQSYGSARLINVDVEEV